MRNLFVSAGLSLLVGVSPALATQGAVNLASPTGSVQTTSDSTATNLINIGAICGATSTATLYIACANQAIVNASGQLGIFGPVTNAGTFAVQLNATPSLANGNGVVPTQGGTALSATNGVFANILQGNAVLSATNGLFDNIVIAGAVQSATNGQYANQLQGNAVLSLTNPSFASITDGTTKAAVDATSHGLQVDLVACATGGSPCNTNGQATAANSSPVVLPVAQVTVDPCSLSAKTTLPISTNATALTQIIAVSGSNKIYICSIALVAPGATAFNLIRGTGTNCATGSPTAIFGSTTAANGMSFAANGGFALGNGSGTVGVTNASDELCTLQSNAVQVAGNLTYVQAP